MLDRAEIAKRIPHAGSMCLLDQVQSYDDNAIICTARTHRDSTNPMSSNGRLGILCAIEYAAQAMAVHGALNGTIDARPRAGYLAALRDVRAMRDYLNDVTGDLTIEARQAMGDGNQVIYNFSVSGDGQIALSGRATVILEVA